MYTLLAMIGASPLRKEDRQLLTGAGRYLDDLRREGMLHLGVLRSVEAHARIVKIEASRARALAGVVAVWSAADLAEITKPIGTASTGRPFAQPVLVPDVARYAGEPVAVVIAESAYRVAETGALVVWSSHQNPYRLRDAVATVLGLPAEGVRVTLPDVGGAFGPKGSIYGEEVLVATATLRLGRAVKWVETRREDFLSLGHDREQEHDARIGFAQDGTIVALE